jgi:hypothetical protein
MEQQSDDIRVLTGIRPRVPEIAYRIPTRASENVLIRSLPVDTFREQGVNSIRHCHFTAIVVLRSSWFKSDSAREQVYLAHPDTEQFAHSPTVGSSHFHEYAKPKLGAVFDRLSVLPVLQVALANEQVGVDPTAAPEALQ